MNRAIEDVQIRGREIPWLQVVQFHKEIVKRAESGFYALNGNDRLNNRWSCLDGFDPDELAGPWTIPEDSITSRPFRQAIEAGEHEALYIGGPGFIGWEASFGKFYPRWQPLLYREITIKEQDDELKLIPAQGEWNVSPLFFGLLDRKSLALPEDSDAFAARMMDLAVRRREGGIESMAQAITDAFCAEFQDTEPELRRHETDDPFDTPATPWVLFAPTSQFSALTRHLLRDYESLVSILDKSPDRIGGLSILEESASGTEKLDHETIPVIPLDDAQKRAVDAILQGGPLTVVSGPPGCGKSQVVVSLLLNAWAHGLKVLFASNNNKAVDVVRERLERFEQENPIAVRAGNRQKAQIEEVLRRVINLVARVKRGDTKGIDPEKVKARQTKLLDRKKAIETTLETGLPQRINEAIESSLKSYSNRQQILQEIETRRLDFLRAFEKLQLPAATRADKVTDLLTAYDEWIEAIVECRALIDEDKTKRADTERHLRKLLEKRTEIASGAGMQIAAEDDASWLLNGPDAAATAKIVEDLKRVIEGVVNSELEQHPWKEEYERWKGSDEASHWADEADAFSQGILSLVNELSPKLKALEKQSAVLAERRDSIVEKGVPETIKIDPLHLDQWSAVYSQIVTHEKKWTDFFPWSAHARYLRELKRLESTMRQAFPLTVWRAVGSLNAEGREVLAGVVEVTRQWIEIRQQWEDAQETIGAIEAHLRDMRKKGGELGFQDVPDSQDMPEWLRFREHVVSDSSLAREAAEFWQRRTTRERIQAQLQGVARDFFDFASGYPLKDAWAMGPGSYFMDAISNLRKEANLDRLQELRTQLYTGILDRFAQAWETLQETQRRISQTEQTIASIPSKQSRIHDWWDVGPDANFVLPEVPADLPQPAALSAALDTAREWNTGWNEFKGTWRPERTDEANQELNWALDKLEGALEALPETEERAQLQSIIEGINKDPEQDWPIAEIREVTAAFSPERLKAKIETIEVELEKSSFEKAKTDWLERLLADDDTVRAVDSLEKSLRKSKGQIGAGQHDLFRKSLGAVPIWITTAQAPQSIPLEPDLFDIVIIDEATQCTLTNLLPLVYRGKRLAVIGDGHQLPAIPTIRGTEERALAKKFGVEDLLEFIGHDENDVYSTAAQSLPRRRADVVMLTNHYRSHPQIIGFSNNQIYQRELRLLRDPKGRRALQAGSGIHVLEVSGHTVRGPKGRSWRNPTEAVAVADLIAGLRNKEDSSLSIGVVAPFRAQVEMIIEELDRRQASRNVLVGTAHQFQGDERDIMVFSPVVARGIPENSAKWVESPPNLINVAVTRAREALFVVADLDFCSRQDGILKHLARYCRTIQSLRETSPAELELFSWMCVEGWSPDVHVPTGDIEVDFILITPSGEKLAIEVDGKEHHDDRQEQDKARDAYLIARGFTVLRFPAREVFETPASVIHRIKVKFDAN